MQSLFVSNEQFDVFIVWLQVTAPGFAEVYFSDIK